MSLVDIDANSWKYIFTIKIIHVWKKWWLGPPRSFQEIATLLFSQDLTKLRNKDSTYVETIILLLDTWGEISLVKLFAASEHYN